MNLTTISTTLPTFTGGGVRNNQWAILDEARRRDHQVNILWLTNDISERNQYELAALSGRRMAVHPIQASAANPYGVAQILQSLSPDVVFALASYNIAWASALNPEIPRVCMMGDLEHQVMLYRRQYAERSKPMDYNELTNIHQAAIATKDTYMPILANCAAVVCSAAHSVQWLNTQQIPAEYVPMPIVDPAFPGWRRRMEDMPQNPKPRILLAGHLGGIATMSGLYWLVEEVMPHLDVDAYEWRVCGSEALVPDLAARFKAYPQVQFTGYVEDIRAEVLQADISLIPTPITLGVRTRLMECWGLGACTIAHVANAVGQPEVIEGDNIILADTGENMASAIKQVVDAGTDLRLQMGNAGRETFDQHFTAPHSAGRIVDIMEQAANGTRKRVYQMGAEGWSG